MTYSTLVASTFNVRWVLLLFAKRSITVDSIVTNSARNRLGEGFVNRHEAVARVNIFRTFDAFRAEVPVRAIQALMAYSVDELLATITDGGVAHIPASVAKEVCQCRKSCVRGRSLESVARVVTMLVANVAFHAEIVVVTGSAGNKFLLGHDCTS